MLSFRPNLSQCMPVSDAECPRRVATTEFLQSQPHARARESFSSKVFPSFAHARSSSGPPPGLAPPPGLEPPKGQMALNSADLSFHGSHSKWEIPCATRDWNSQKSRVTNELSRKCRKTKLCRYLPGCVRGAACNYAHSIEELQSSPDFLKTKLCIGWASNCCRYTAETCAFAHGVEELNCERVSNVDDSDYQEVSLKGITSGVRYAEGFKASKANLVASPYYVDTEIPALTSATRHMSIGSTVSTDIDSKGASDSEGASTPKGRECYDICD